MKIHIKTLVLFILGILFISLSLFILKRPVSFFYDSVVEVDPFQANYSSVLPQATPTESPLPASSPISLPSPSPAASASPTTNATHLILLYPAAEATLTNTRLPSQGYPLKLKFEIDPRSTIVKLELEREGTSVLSKELKGSPTGFYEVSLLIKKPGTYTWQITSNSGFSERRNFKIVNENH